MPQGTSSTIAMGQTMADPGLSSTVAADPATSATMAVASGREIAPPSQLPTSTMPRSAVLPVVQSTGDAPVLVHQPRARYVQQRVLGAGGMGEVTLAFDEDIGRSVAIKSLHASGGNPMGIARFVEEIRTVGALEHPNIVPIHDVGLGEDGRYYFVMKHVDGKSLEDVIDALRRGDKKTMAEWTFEHRIEVFLGVLRALAYAHARGVIHRDLKPANVLVGRYGEVWLMDWGVAKSKNRATLAEKSDGTSTKDDPNASMFTTRHGSLIGTPAYMSPEQAKGEVDAIDARSDIYSACVMFLELVTLKHYLGSKSTVAEMLLAIVADAPPSVPGLASNLHPAQNGTPAELLHFCVKGLQKDPAQRFQSVEEMIDQLERTLAGEVKVQCPFTFTKRVTRELGRMVDRKPVLTATALFAMLMLVIWGLVATGLMIARAKGHA